MEQEGIYSYIVPGKFGDVVVFADDIDHYLYQPELVVPYRETAGLEAGIESVFALETHVQTVPQSYRVADYTSTFGFWCRYVHRTQRLAKSRTATLRWAQV